MVLTGGETALARAICSIEPIERTARKALLSLALKSLKEFACGRLYPAPTYKPSGLEFLGKGGPSIEVSAGSQRDRGTAKPPMALGVGLAGRRETDICGVRLAPHLCQHDLTVLTLRNRPRTAAC